MIVLVNPRARGMKRDRALPARLRELVRGLGEVIVLDDPDAVARELAARGVDLVALCGGDGTGSTVLTALERAYGTRLPRVALLRGGTINTVASDLGVRGTPETLLRSLCDRLRTGAPLPQVQHTLLRVDDRLGFVFAAALGARFLERYYDRDAPSLSRAVRLAAEVAASALVSGSSSRALFAPMHARLVLDDHPHELDARLLVASTIRDVGVGMRITPRAGVRPGHFQLVASGLTPTQMARQIPAVQAGRALTGTPHLDRLCRRATVELDREEPYTLDGDLFRARTLTIAAAGPLRLVR